MPRFRKHLNGALIGTLLGMFAGVFSPLGIGIANLYIARQSEAQIAQFPTLGLSALLDRDAGSAVAVEGHITGTSRFQSLVAYEYQEAERSSSDESRRWRTVDQIRPPLRVELSDGSVPITGPYTLTGATITLHSDSEERYIGLENRQLVFAWGKLRQEDAGPALVAETIYAGTRADYLAEQSTLRMIAWFLIGLGVGLAMLFAWIFPRFILPMAR